MGWSDLWNYRELFRAMLWRDLKVRFKQTALGSSWIILRPLALVLIMNAVFGRMGGFVESAVPYALVVLSGLISWELFAGAVNRSISSLLSNADLMKKIYFPRLYVPLAAMVTSILDFCFSLLAWFPLAFYYGFWPTSSLLFLPVFVLLTVAAALGLGLWLSALNLRYRDFDHIAPLLLQIGFFASPVIYGIRLVPKEWWGVVHAVNPMAGVISGMRWCLLGHDPPGSVVGLSILTICLLLFSGLAYFRMVESSFADVA